ncbi:MAG: glycosyltransferase, partial [Paludibacteraceae bacterium]|nr:glycosyltransferase [Paludibacteraceae bacterium]
RVQTYPYIELIIADDSSNDNTVDVCRNWLNINKERFTHTQIIESEHNTGIAGNLNRGEDACTGKWVKSIAGDDKLMPTCLEDCVNYMQAHEDAVYLFGKVKAFGASHEKCRHYERLFKGSFFKMTPKEQLDQLIFDGNEVPAATCFYDREKALKIGVRNDERMPFLEDWPKWINLLRAGVIFHYIDTYLVEYRLEGISTTSKMQSPKFHRSERTFFYLYQFPKRYAKDPMGTINSILNDEECKVYDTYYTLCNSYAYRVGKIIMKPFSYIKSLFGK